MYIYIYFALLLYSFIPCVQMTWQLDIHPARYQTFCPADDGRVTCIFLTVTLPGIYISIYKSQDWQGEKHVASFGLPWQGEF